MLRVSGGEPTKKKKKASSTGLFCFITLIQDSIQEAPHDQEEGWNYIESVLSVDVSHLVLYFRLLNNFIRR